MKRPHINEHGQIDLPSIEALERRELRDWLYERLHGPDINVPSDPRDGGMPHFLISVIYPKLSRIVQEDLRGIVFDFVKDLAANPRSPWRNEAGEELLMLTDPVLVHSNRREDMIDVLHGFADSPELLSQTSTALRIRVLQALVALEYRTTREFWHQQGQLLLTRQFPVIIEGLGLIDLSAVFEWLSQRNWDDSFKTIAFSVLPILVESYTAAKFISVLENMLPELSPDCAAGLRDFCEDQGLCLSPSADVIVPPLSLLSVDSSASKRKTGREGAGTQRRELAVVGMPLPLVTHSEAPWIHTLINFMLPEFDHEMSLTRKALERLPEENLAWRPHKKSMSFRELANHLVNIPDWTPLIIDTDFFDVVTNRPTPELESRQKILNAFDNNVNQARKAISSANDDHLMKPWSLLSRGKQIFTLPRMAVLRSFVLNHVIHHRAQFCVYLRLNNIPVPSIYGPSADEL